jgi:ribosome recycling factor
MAQEYKPFIEKAKPEFDKAFKFLEAELAKLRTSRATPAIVEDISVTVAGQKFSVKELGGISVPQQNQLVIQPWDASYLEPMEKAIAQAAPSLSVSVDKNVVRVTMPQLTEEFRAQLSKALNEKAEQARETIRRVRDEAWSGIQKAEREKKMAEDDKFRGKDELQKVTDEVNEKIKTLTEKKKQEMMS